MFFRKLKCAKFDTSERHNNDLYSNVCFSTGGLKIGLTVRIQNKVIFVSLWSLFTNRNGLNMIFLEENKKVFIYRHMVFSIKYKNNIFFFKLQHVIHVGCISMTFYGIQKDAITLVFSHLTRYLARLLWMNFWISDP